MEERKTLKKLFVIRGSGFDLDFADYSTNSDLKELRKAFRERKYTVSQVGLPYRIINNWEEQGVLPNTFREDASEWRKFTYIEAVWLTVVLRLRKFGLPLSKISQIKDCVMEWDEKTEAYPLFEYYFYKAIVNDADHLVIYLPEMGADLVSTGQLEILRSLGKEQDILLISLKSVARSMRHDVADAKPLLTLSDGEQEFVVNARVAHTKEIRAKVSRGRVVETEDEKTYEDDSLLKGIFESMRNEGAFGEVTTKLEEGKKQSVTVKTRKRFQ